MDTKFLISSILILAYIFQVEVKAATFSIINNGATFDDGKTDISQVNLCNISSYIIYKNTRHSFLYNEKNTK